ncbi:MAG: DNA photolyase family protein [Acidimicrobiia bacterium]|nr:DNA photolyase family protein [Acidimicrobiia bacterium]
MSTTSNRGPGVVWFRRDLRLDDNPAWAAATAAHDRVLALFVLEPALIDTAGDHRRNLFLAHLNVLHRDLEELDGGLVVRPGPAVDAVTAVLAEVGAAALYLNHDYSPFARRRDQSVIAAIDNLGGNRQVTVRRFHGNVVHRPGSVLTKAGSLSKVFTPFYKEWVDTPLDRWPEPGDGRPLVIDGEPMPEPDKPPARAAGNAGAWKRLREWLDQVADYDDTRDIPAISGTSDLSADLKFGTLGARTVVEAVGEATRGHAAFVRQLAWRDWYAHTLVAQPDLAARAVRPEYDRIKWRDDDGDFEAWASGQTGYPIVDAGMRQLVQTGWMHNRVRMITASFLVKDLLIDWRRGERFFRHHLIDADPAQNAGNWQWVAGTGFDAAPYFRIFNPVSQAAKFDPHGHYIRRWIPELAQLGDDQIHDPAAVPPLQLAASGVILGDTYPEPVVDHGEARERALVAYKAALGRN